MEQGQIYTMTLDTFRGVDYTADRKSVDPSRATELVNFINENGTNVKRHGYHQTLDFKPYLSSENTDTTVKGLWEFVSNGKNLMCAVVGADILLFEESETGYDLITSFSVTGTSVNSVIPYGTIMNGMLYLLYGDYYRIKYADGETEQAIALVSDDATVPTTTISIVPELWVTTTDKTNQSAHTYMPVNVLNRWRKNTGMIPHDVLTKGYSSVVYFLDTEEIDLNSTVTMTINELNSDNEVVEVQYLADKDHLSSLGDHAWKFYKPGDSSFTKTIALFYKARYKNQYDSAFIVFESDTFESVFGNAIKSEQDTISFTFKTLSDDSSKIRHCTFGTAFGAYGGGDRLFLSGNPGFPNMDFWSQPNDPTYFGAYSYAKMGADSVPITGYSRLGDGTLAVHKAAESRQDATVFYRSTGSSTKYDDSGNEVGEETLFPVKMGAVGEGCVNHRVTENLSGDPVIVSENGVFGISLVDNSATNERYAKSRSMLINGRLTKEDLKNAFATVYKGKYFLFVSGKCYIADSAYKYSVSDTYNYEWWLWDNIPATCAAIIDDKLTIGTGNGELCVFDETDYWDKRFVSVPDGGLTLDLNASTFTIAGAYADIVGEMTDTDKIEINGTLSEVLFGTDELTYTDGVFHTDSESKLKYLYSGMEVISGGNTYYLSDIDLANGTFKVNGLSEVAEICRNIGSGELVGVTNASGNDFQIQSVYGGAATLRADFTISWSAQIHIMRPVECLWESAVFDFGTTLNAKTLKGVSVSPNTIKNGQISFGYETRTKNKWFPIKGVTYFSFNSFSFSALSFETSKFPKSYVKSLNEKNFNHMLFRIKSVNARDCAINGITLKYTLGRANKGVR